MRTHCTLPDGTHNIGENIYLCQEHDGVINSSISVHTITITLITQTQEVENRKSSVEKKALKCKFE